MEGLLILTALLAITDGQVVFPEAEESSSGSSNSNDLDSQLIAALSSSDRNFFSQSNNENTCHLPDGNLGNCRHFSQCSEYSNLASVLNTPSVLSFLRARVCRILSNSVQICCPVGNQPTQRPTNPTPPQSGSQNPLFPTDCGTSFADRIIHGTEVPVGAYPWLTGIGSPNPRGGFNVNCGGSLITRRHVLTAAHCFDSFFKPTHVIVGEHDVTSNNDGANPQTLSISNFKLADYSSDTNQNDLALLTLEREVSFNSNIQPICLPFRPDLRNNNFVGNHLDVTGWGRTNHTIRQTSPVPLEAKVEVVTLEKCKEAYKKLSKPFFIIESQLCAGTGGRDSCNGDSGGPLHYIDQQTGKYYLAGVVSFGVDCGRPDFPGVYARVGSYLDWIESNLN